MKDPKEPEQKPSKEALKSDNSSSKVNLNFKSIRQQVQESIEQSKTETSENKADVMNEFGIDEKVLNALSKRSRIELNISA
jgi:hypothetical protein